MGWVWNRAFCLRGRKSAHAPSAFWEGRWDRRLNRAIFSARLSVDRSGSSVAAPSPVPTSPDGTAAAFSCGAELGAEGVCMLGGDNQNHITTRNANRIEDFAGLQKHHQDAYMLQKNRLKKFLIRYAYQLKFITFKVF